MAWHSGEKWLCGVGGKVSGDFYWRPAPFDDWHPLFFNLGVLLCVLANKNDAANARSAETLTNFFGLGGQKDLGRVAFLHSVSAKTGDGIKDAMEHLAKAVKESHSAKKDKE